MISATKFAECALLSKWDKYTYEEMDCQAFVEAVLKDIGIRKPNGSVYNWSGSNSMYRNYYSWHGTIDECKQKFGRIPVGCFVYIHKDSGQPSGYNDGLGNFSHVGIYCGNDVVRDSTRSTKTKRNGVGTRTLNGFGYVSLFGGLDYSTDNSYNANVESILSYIDRIKNILVEMEKVADELFRS